MFKTSTAIKNFLAASGIPADLVNYYNPDMEVQVNAAQDGGEIITKQGVSKSYRRYTDGLTEWGPIRIPKNAGTVPEDNDFDIKWDLAAHAEGIGLTGWDWRAKVSRYVAFDFDSISGHTRAGLTDAELNEIKAQAKQIPWVTVRKSTSGKGLHLYVLLAEQDPSGKWFGGVETANHNEHAALARAILGKMAAVAEFDFQAKIDVCGGNMWIWHRKQKGTDGLTLVKLGEVLTEIPINWKDHLTVVRGERKRTVPKIISEDKHDVFEELTGTHVRVPLNDEHKKLIAYLEDTKSLHWWDADRHLLVAHTFDLKNAYNALSLRGIFDTIATGREHGGDQNCFMFPLSNGGWVVRRHTPGVQEHGSWDQDGKGWTRCYFNTQPDLKTAAGSFDGVEHPKGGYAFPDVASGKKTLETLGINFELPAALMDRGGVRLKENKDGKLVLEIPKEAHDAGDKMRGWVEEGKFWKRVFYAPTKIVEETDVSVLAISDKIVRHLIDMNIADAGWVIHNSAGQWQHEKLEHVRAAIGTFGFNPKEVSEVIGANVMHSWKLVNNPFGPEYPGNREWNKDAAQFRFVPSQNRDNLNCPTWLKILNHCGETLTPAILRHSWCIANGITTGGEYLLHWVASVFQNPDKPLPYLFFWSKEQDTGKSSFHEALSLLMTRGYESAESALTNESGFNGELASAVLCIVEEKDISTSKVAYSRIKNWVTARYLPIHPKGGTPYLTRNCTHWVHCANDPNACPVFPGDTRITWINVQPIDLIDMIPKHELVSKLEAEAEDFLRMCLDLEIPSADGRLTIPMIETEGKKVISDRNESILDAFIKEFCWQVPGYYISFKEFYDRFEKSINDPAEQGKWSKKRVSMHLPISCPSARLTTDPNYHIGNLAWKIDAEGNEIPKPDNKPRLEKRDYKLVPVGE